MPVTKQSLKRKADDDLVDPTSFTKSAIRKSMTQPIQDEAQSSTTRNLPAGRRLLPQIVNDLAASDPNGTWLSVPSRSQSTDEFMDISYNQLANAVNRAAWWINTCAKTLPSHHTLAYIGPTDSRYLILIIAAAKAGHWLLLPSTRNTDAMQQQLLRATGCTVILCASGQEQSVTKMMSRSDDVQDAFSVYVVPEQDVLLSTADVDEFPYSKTFDQERDKPFVILHTSGTTGEVKPVRLPHAYYAYEDACQVQFVEDGVLTFAPLKQGARCLYTGPLYHAGAILFTFMKGLLLKTTMVLPPANLPVTAEVVASCILNGHANMLGTAPTVLEEICSDPVHVDCLDRLEYVFCGSGPLPISVGDSVVAINRCMLHIYGSTETALLPQLPLEDARDWQYFKFHPASGVVFVPLGKEGLHELVIKRREDCRLQPCFEILPHLKEYHSNDTFSEHPTKQGLWRFEGRLDDIITLTNGEKFCPTATEEAVTRHPAVIEALVVGHGRFQPALIIGMHNIAANFGEALKVIWPVVEKENMRVPGYGRIGKSLITIARTPFLRTPKGTIRRQDTERTFRDILNALYEAHTCAFGDDYVITDLESQDSIEDFVQGIVSDKVAGGTKLDPEADLFLYGLDSLKVGELVGAINASLKRSITMNGHNHLTRIGAPLVYRSRSISRLAVALKAHLDRPKTPIEREMWLQESKVLLQRYAASLQGLLVLPKTIKTIQPSLEVVLLTGSTGSLGKHLLYQLLRQPNTNRIYCLDRSCNAKQSYLDTFPADREKLDRIIFLHVPSLSASLKNDESPLRAHMQLVTTVIHNAWPVNFNLPLQAPEGQILGDTSFEADVAGLCELIKCAVTSPRKPQLVFISSVSSSSNCIDHGRGRIPERIVEDPSAPANGTYSRSKWLAEVLLDRAAKFGYFMLQPKVIRIGQIVGPSPNISVARGTGSVWSEKEAIPSLIRSSATVRALPRTLYEMERLDWITVDQVSKSVLDIAGHQNFTGQTGAGIYNLALPADEMTTWESSMLPPIKARLEQIVGGQIDIISLQEWVLRVEKRSNLGLGGVRMTGKIDNPAIRLLGFYEGLGRSDADSGTSSVIDAHNAYEASECARNLQPVDPAWVVGWMADWGL